MTGNLNPQFIFLTAPMLTRAHGSGRCALDVQIRNSASLPECKDIYNLRGPPYFYNAPLLIEMIRVGMIRVKRIIRVLTSNQSATISRFNFCQGDVMSVRKGIAPLLALTMLAFLVACGGSSSPKVVPPPGGGFNNTSLNGTYVFSTSGVDASGFFTTIVGSFTAQGGSISGGTLDLVSADPNVLVNPNVPITSSTYRITADGRGQTTLNASIGPIGLDFVLTSTSHGLITEFDANGTGSGTIDLQSNAIAQTAITALSFSLTGTGPGPSYSPSATVGSVTLNASGGVTAGIQDSQATTGQSIGTTSFITVGTGTTPGTAQLITTGTYKFDVYAIDSTHLKFIETDGLLFTSGDAYTPATSIPSGTLAFTMSGFDTTSNPLALGGLLPASSTGTITAGLEDYNDGGNVNQVTTVAGSFAALSGGRSVLTLNNFVNGAASDLPGSYTFAAYPITSNGVTGIQLLEIDGLGVTTGSAFLQSSVSLGASQGYGLNLSAVNSGNGSGAFEEDDIAQFTTTSSGFSGIVDINDEGNTTFDQALSGSLTAPDSTGRGTATTTEHGNAFISYAFYVVNSSTILFLETDTNQIGAGIFELQNASASPGAEPGIVTLRPAPQAHVLRRK